MSATLSLSARRALGVALAASTIAFAGAAGAQAVYDPNYQAGYEAGYADGITVYSRPYAPRDGDELSARVTYSDLDLTTRAGVDELRWRIRNTAQALCDDLGEGDEVGRNTAVLPSCQAAARDRADSHVRRAVDDAYYAAGYRRAGY